MSPVGFCAVARAQGRAPDRLGSTGVTNASEERRAEHRGAPLAGCAETRRATVARHQQSHPTGVHEQASQPAPADHGNTPYPVTGGIDTMGSGMALPMARTCAHRLSIPRCDRGAHETCSGRKDAAPAALRDDVDANPASRARRQPEVAEGVRKPGRNGRNAVRVRSTRYPTRRVTHRPTSLSLVIFRAPPIHTEELPWLSNSTDCHRRNCRF
ncbi:hypothetical protein SAMN05192579_107151 [Rhodanobacter glycinis]|uniref:Uncharacterized protein n=1 Tax=Rhodanobacter glycinis TaxID=582702 RepID=A0A1I4CRV2_9GAMM|nr:hypothetical protein SAMN05192579_107151 [Rhodanobacter glycinis]